MPTVQAFLLPVPQELETARLVLRPAHQRQAGALLEAIVESLPDLRRWDASLPWALAQPTLDSCAGFCHQARQDFVKHDALVYFYHDKDSGALVGSASLHNIDWRVPKFEVGYWCRSALHNRGLTTEVVKALAHLALHTLRGRRLQCTTDALNLASQRVCEKAGMVREAVLHQHEIDSHGVLRDTCLYAAYG